MPENILLVLHQRSAPLMNRKGMSCGVNKAVVEQFSVKASTSGTITIQFTSVVDQAQINGIEILS